MGEGVKVGIADTGITLNHPDLRDNILDAKDFSKSRTGPSDGNGHGTHVAGIIAASQNSLGMIGVAPKAKIVAAKVLGDDGSGGSSQIAKGIDWLVDQKVDIINMSLGSPTPDEGIHRSIKRAVEAGVFICCAAGNEGPSLDTVGYPARFPECISVASINRDKNISEFSSRGDRVDVAAPGEDIYSCYPPNVYAKLSGTSMADPFVTGVCALVVSKERAHPGTVKLESQADLIKVLRSTATGTGGLDTAFGYGIIDPDKLLKLFDSTVPSPGDPASKNRTLELLASVDLTPAGLVKCQEFYGKPDFSRLVITLE
jgi:subtilisin family serine protease